MRNVCGLKYILKKYNKTFSITISGWLVDVLVDVCTEFIKWRNNNNNNNIILWNLVNKQPKKK